MTGVPEPLLLVDGSLVEAGGRVVARVRGLVLDSPGVYLLVGPNGSGKTSLLSAIAGRRGYRLRGGAALYMGEPLDGMGLAERARSGLVYAYQSPPPLRGVTLRVLEEEVRRALGGASPAASRVAELLGIEGLRDKELAAMSGGERRRAELYLAALQSPRVALLDEPDSGVDVDWAKAMAEAITVLAERQRAAVLLVSHTTGFMTCLAAGARRVFLAHDGAVEPLPLEPLEAVRLLERRGFNALREAAERARGAAR